MRLKISVFLTALLFYYQTWERCHFTIGSEKFRYYIDKDTKGVTNAHPE